GRFDGIYRRQVEGGLMRTRARAMYWFGGSTTAKGSVFAILLFCCLGTGSNLLMAQAKPSPDPVPLIIILTRLDKGDPAGAERLMRDNLPVMKKRLEEKIAEFDEKFDELGRSGATAGHDVHTEILQQFIADVTRQEKLFDLYRRITGDEVIYKRVEARRLRY